MVEPNNSAKPEKILENVKFPEPTKVYRIFSYKFVFKYSVLHLCLMSYTFMYLNMVTQYKFSVYNTLMTGNLVRGSLDLLGGERHLNGTLFCATIIFVSCFLGTSLNCYLLLVLQSRENTMAVLMVLLVLSCLFMDYIDDITPSKYVICFLAIVTGALAHWSQKFNYVCTAQTGNMVSLYS